MKSSLQETYFRLIPFIIILNLVIIPNSEAQSYFQPMLGINWDTHDISFSIPLTPVWAHNALEEAMNDWEMAQLWFIDTYFPSHTSAEFFFIPAAKGTQSQLTIEYANDTGQFWTGDTEVPASGHIANETILLVLSRLAAPGDVIQVTQHELGHVLGLDHTAYSQDLMYPAMDAFSGGEPVNPSTVNLYGVYMLGIGCSFSPGQTADLPSWIPYLEWSPNIQENPSNVPQSISSANPCPAQRQLWTEPWFGFSMVAMIVLLAIGFAVRRRHPRATGSVQY